MIFSSKEQLSILQIDDSSDMVSIDTIGSLLFDKPSNILYCEKNGSLYGIISMGDIHRAREENLTSVAINKSFTYLCGFEYMRARKIFLENDKINALPIVDEEHRLLGNYSRWGDVFSGYEFEFLKSNKYFDMIWNKYKMVAIVKPSLPSSRKKKLVEMWSDFFNSKEIDVEVISKENIMDAFNTKDMIFFTDEDEIRGLGTFYKDVLDKNFNWEQAKTFKVVEETVEEAVEEAVGEAVGEEVLKEFINDGVYLITISVKGTGNDYWKRIEKELNEKFEAIGKKRENILYKEFWKDFFDEIYSYDYAKEIAYRPQTCVRDGMVIRLKDTESKYYNVRNGERLTVGQPSDYCNTIYFFGCCVAVGQKAEDAHTIESFLQHKLNANGYKVKVVNYGNWCNRLQLLHNICSIDFKKGNIIIVYDDSREYQGIPNVNLGKALEENNVSSKCFINSVNHANYKVYKLWAEEIYKVIPQYLLIKKAEEKARSIRVPASDIIRSYINRYFVDYEPKATTGAIVMNCNPFTKGHLHLIEYAAEKVEQLIIFVVEENKSIFSFRERFAMVREGTKDIKNVNVVPSGQYILSQTTFPEYFIKIEDADLKKNAEHDIRLFAKEIAPRLNIKYRFVGEEKTDMVTAEYNNAMRRILPQYGIELIEIPRRKISGTDDVISATRVRDYIELGEWKKIEELVPKSTMDILSTAW